MSERFADAAPVLTLENYYSWERQMQWHLKGRKDGTLLWACVEESAAFTSATPENRSQATAIVQSVLMRTVPSILEDLVHTAASAKLAWSGIKKFFEQGMQERKAHMLREYLNLKQSADTIPVFLLTLESKKKELKEKCNYTVDDDLQMLVLCDAVRKEYAQKLDVVKLKDTYTYEDMKKALVSEDIRLRQQPGQALQTRSRPKDILCYACGEKGHKRPDCKASQAQRDAYRKKWLASKQRRSKDAQPNSEGKSAICFSASSYLQGKLLYDSGATDHVVTDSKFIHNLQKSTLLSIKAAGDEAHQVCGMGDVLW
jgi:hypothetical protein